MNKTIWLARMLMCGKALSKEEILAAWCREDVRGLPMARSTFHENLKRLRQVYGINVQCRDGLYSLGTDLHGDSEAMRRLTGSDGTTPRLSDDRILQTIGMWRPVITEAMGLHQTLRMTYLSPTKGNYETLLSPYCIHEVGNLCYVVGFSSRHRSIRIFALDRIDNLQLMPTHYRMPDGFSEDQYFSASIGAYAGPELRPTTVVFEADTSLSRYLRNRPMHRSQREVGQQTFAIDIAITRDLIDKFLSLGPSLTVRRPDSLVMTIRELLSAALQNYSTSSTPE